MKLYKYTSMTSAIKIIKSSSVILNNPEKFNDPFDSKIVINEKSKKEALNLIYNFHLYKEIKDIIDNEDIKLTKTQKMLFSILKTEYKVYEKLVFKDKEYKKVPLLNKILYFFEKLILDFGKFKSEIEIKFNNMSEKIRSEIKSKLLITCFSKKNDSILMWSHYGDSHKGVCFEFEEDRDIFEEVNYTGKRPNLDLKKLIGRYLMCEFKNEECDFSEDEYQKSIIEQFFTKQNEWSYEQEIRCVLSKDNTSLDDFYYENDNYFLKMKIKKIYIGSKASGETLNI